MARKKHLISVHTGTGTTAPTNASLYLGEIAVQHTPNDPALWIKVGTGESSTDYEKFIGETEILELIKNTETILGSGYTYSGLPYVNSATTIANAYSALTEEMIKDEKVVAAALNDLNNRVMDICATTLNSSELIDRIQENEETMTGALNDLDERVAILEVSGCSSGDFEALSAMVFTDEYVVAAALNNLNSRIVELSGNTGGPETDPIFSSSVAAGITQTDINNWNAAAGGGGTDPNAITGITMNGNAVSVSNRVAGLGTVVTAETQLSKGTTTGTGNVVTDLSVNNHQITLAKSFSAAPADLFVTLSGATNSKITSLSAATTAHTGNSDIHVTNTEKSTWNGKQNAITDLATIRTNAASGMVAYNDVTALSAGTIGELSKKSNTGHTHAISDITNLQSALDGKSDTSHTHSDYATTGTVNTLNDTVTAHTANTSIHVTTAQTAAWNGKQDAISDLATIRSNAASGMSAYNNVNALSAGTISELAKKSNTGHTHAISDITNLQTTLDGKSGTGHTHSDYATTANLNNLSGGTTAHTSNSAIHVPTGGTNGQVLMVENGVPTWVTPATITYSSSEPTGGNEGDIWVQIS